MSDDKIVEKDDWNTILGELDEIVRETERLSAMSLGDKNAFEDEEFPAMIHFISEIKKEKKSQSWEKLEGFAQKTKENLKLLEETQQIKMHDKRIDRSFIGVLPKNTEEIGQNAMEILNEIPLVLRTINESIEALLIDIKLKIGFPIIRIEKEILDIKHQIELLEAEITSHTKTKKGFVSRDERMIYTQAYRETLHEILEKAQSYVTRGMKAHSKAFEDVYDRYISRINNYRQSPAYDDFIGENCTEIEKAIDNWPTEGFQAFTIALKFVRKIDDRLSDTRQVYIQQIKAELEKDISELVSKIENLYNLDSKVDVTLFTKIKESSEKVISAVNFFLKTTDVVLADPHDKLINDEKILRDATKMTESAYEATYGSFEKRLNEYINQIPPSKSTNKILELINETKEICSNPNNLVDAVNVIPTILDYKKNIDLLLKEMASDIVSTQAKFVKRIKNINIIIGKGEAITVPSDNDLISIEKVNLDDPVSLNKVSELLKDSLVQTVNALASFEKNFSEGLGISINPNLEGKISKYRRPSYSPTVKQANTAMSELEKIAKNLTLDTGSAITNYAKNLNKFTVNSSALKALQKLLRAIGNDAIAGKLTLSQITAKLENAVIEYSKLIQVVINEYSEDLSIIMKNMDKAQISEGMTLDNFGLKHDELISNISLESVIMQQDKKKPKLLCKVCKGKIVSQQSEYNDMLGLDVLKVKCENGHDDNIIGFGEDEKEEKQETIEIECAKCGSDTLTPTKIDIYTKDELVVFAACPMNHESNFTIKKK
jgi:hypothetical protein